MLNDIHKFIVDKEAEKNNKKHFQNGFKWNEQARNYKKTK